eukprot:scaffold618_cov175-Amphora_coffeaeformis.AAC.7
MNDSSVTRTASDAIQAKASAILNAGYHPDVPGAETYVKLLRGIFGTPAPKRQTPLVHAGYLLRIQLILSLVQRFVDYVGDDAQIIFLGGGMDVTGLWAGQSFAPSQVRSVLELDLPTVCAAKHEILEQQGLVTFGQQQPTESHIHQGSLKQDPSTQFALVQVDLRSDDIVWEDVLPKSCWDSKFPTLIISEVVLAYIGQEATDRVLSGLVTALQHAESCMILLEPLGPSFPANDPLQNEQTVLQSYQESYACMFQEKMERGGKADPNIFTPVGSSPRDVARRIRSRGWGSAIAVSLANATASTASANYKAKEPFDEQVALLLHAQSYVVACGFPPGGSALFRRVMAPWQSNVKPFRLNKHLWITSIDQTEEVTVKDWFFEGYGELTRTYKSVYKLMQGTLKKDLILTNVDPADEGVDFTSHFSKYYQERDGCFLVAIDSRNQQIAGFIALSKASPHAKGLASKCPYTFEVHRLFVVPEYRSQGMAGHLMDAVQGFGMDKVPPGDTATFLAATLNVLDAANRFYERRGFVLHDKEPLPGVLLHHYTLRVHKTANVTTEN